MPVRSEYYIWANLVPNGSDVNIKDDDNVSIYSTNPKVADITSIEMLDEGFEMEINSYRFGKTTIVLELNGRKTEVQVMVKPKIVIFFENLLNRLLGR